MSDKVKFIRVRGRIVPIRPKKETADAAARLIGSTYIAAGAVSVGIGAKRASSGLKEARAGYQAAVGSAKAFGTKAALAGHLSPYNIARNTARNGMATAKSGVKIAGLGLALVTVGAALRALGKKPKK
jgi:hypothetical protein